MSATLKSRLPAIAAGLDPVVNAAVHTGAEIVAERARDKAPDAPPIGQGLVEDIHVEDNEDGSYVLTNWMAHFLEFGTVKMSAQPFLIPAAEESREEVAAVVTVALRGL